VQEHPVDIPGYIIVLGVLSVLVLGGLGYEAFQFFHHAEPPSLEERETGSQDIDAMIDARREAEEPSSHEVLQGGAKTEAFTRAEAGKPEAQYQVGNFYLFGDNPDYGTAQQWYLKAAAQDYAPAEYEAGRMYAGDYQVQADPKEALNLYRRSAGHGYKWAQLQLGEIETHLLAEQFGAKQDFPDAYFWLSVGAAGEDPHSDFVRDRDAAGSHMSEKDKARADRRIEDWKRAHPAPTKAAPETK
jgi:TPR repeat protein